MKSEVGSRKYEETRRRQSRLPRSRFPAAFALPTSHFSPAFTLVELMLVLAVIGVLAAVAWPSVLRMQADHEMSSAAEEVRQLLAHARREAIHSGLAYQFRYQPNGQRFCVIPFETEPSTADAATTPGSQSTPSVMKYSGVLPKTISFAPASPLSSVVATMGQKLPDTAFQGLPDATELASVEWSAPLLFLAEGTTQDATVTLADRRGNRIDVQVRGLTGAAAIGSMRQEAVR